MDKEGFCGWVSEQHHRWYLACGPYSVKICKRILFQYPVTALKKILPFGVSPLDNGGQNGRSQKRAGQGSRYLLGL